MGRTPSTRSVSVRFPLVIFALLSVLALPGCEAVGHMFCAPNCQSQNHNSSSLVTFLYPDGKAPPQNNNIPQLRLPLRVGLAFLPSEGNFGAPALDAAHKNDLLERIRQHFSSQKFISEIVL